MDCVTFRTRWPLFKAQTARLHQSLNSMGVPRREGAYSYGHNHGLKAFFRDRQTILPKG